ncbi:MAG: glycosyltransferase family 2 protein [Oligoflexia bacterium]|nr:glycosyltransferase family 2 protein [Oligoflexia bacterium]
MLSLIYEKFCRKFVNDTIATEINVYSPYFDSLHQVNPLPEDAKLIYDACKTKNKFQHHNLSEIPPSKSTKDRRLFLLNGNGNYSFDIEGLLRSIRDNMSRHDRLCIVFYNPYFRILFYFANILGIRKAEIPTTFCTRKDIHTLLKLAKFDLVKEQPAAYFPFRFFGLGTLINRSLQVLPLIKWLGIADVMLLRPIIPSKDRPSLSIVIPARNEKGNIENALKRMPDFHTDTEIIFIEGHSTDGTWEEIQRVAKSYTGPLKIKIAQQTGKGKSDAVRLGFSLASKEILTILDADLTMPPEQLPRFYESYLNGLGDFINGNRLVYPMEGEAMRFLNHLGNIFFAKFLSSILETPLGDSLCGTKLMTKVDYDRFTNWRKIFGDFDPFGDFEIIFPASIMGLGTMDLPIRYRDRTYGSTNIHRFRHGLILLKMCTIGLLRIRFGKGT